MDNVYIAWVIVMIVFAAINEFLNEAQCDNTECKLRIVRHSDREFR
jgi:hypothetical protein